MINWYLSDIVVLLKMCKFKSFSSVPNVRYGPREYAARVMFRGAFTRKVRVALKHMVRASLVYLSPFFQQSSLSFPPPRRRRINKIPQTRGDERLLCHAGREKWPKIWYSGLKTLKFKTRPSRIISFFARAIREEGREVVKGQFQPHAVVTNPPVGPQRFPSPCFPVDRRSTRILFLSPRNSPARTAIWHRRAVWIPNSIGRVRSLFRFREIKGGSRIDSIGSGACMRTCYVCTCGFYELSSQPAKLPSNLVVGLLRYI